MALSVMFRRRARLSAALTCARVSFAARAGSGALPSSSSVSGASRSSKASSAAGKYSRSWCRSRCTARVRSQISVLCVRASTLMPSASGAVAGHRPQLVGVGAHHVREHVRVAAVALGARTRRAAPGTATPAAGSPRTPCTRPRPAPATHGPRSVSIPTDHLRVVRVLAQVPPDQLVQPRPSRPRPRAAAASPAPSRPRPSPPRRDGPQPSHHPRTAAPALPSSDAETPSAASGRTISDLMKLCSRQQAGTTSQQRSTLPVTGRGTIFRQGSKPRRQKCSPAGGHHIRSLPDGGLPETH